MPNTYMASLVKSHADSLWGGGVKPLLVVRKIRRRADLVYKRFQSVTAPNTYFGSVLLPPRLLGGAQET